MPLIGTRGAASSRGYGRFGGASLRDPILNMTLAQAAAQVSFVPGDTINVSYTGGAQSFNTKNITSFYFEAEGAGGGCGDTGCQADGTGGVGGGNNGVPRGGRGAYVKGLVAASRDTTYYIYVGGKGTSTVPSQNCVGGWNGGGSNYDYRTDWSVGPPGGATDLRVGGTGYNNRILVAGGGGAGSRCGGGELGGHAGYPTGSSGELGNNGAGGGQSGGGAGGGDNSQAGGFGWGGNISSSSNQGYGDANSGLMVGVGNCSCNHLGGAGGGGWYGGGSGGYHMGPGGGGSSYYNSGVVSNFTYTNYTTRTANYHGSAKITVVTI